MEKKEAINLEKVVAGVLFTVGVPADLRGYRYLKNAICMAVENMEVVDSISRDLYAPLARQFQTTPGRVERAIRHAIEVAWDRGDLHILQRFFGYTVSNTKGKPTNSEFIARIADNLQMKLRLGEITADEQGQGVSDDTVLVSKALQEVSVSPHMKGYRYLREAILLALADESAVYDMTERIYTPVAARFDTTPLLVMRAMARARANAWDFCDLDVLQEYFVFTISNTKGLPTVSEFVAMLAERIRLGLSPSSNG